MSDQKNITIGLFGFGVVGEGIYEVLQQTPSLHAGIKKVCIRDSTKKRNAPAHLFTTNYADILEDESINVVVELINDAAEAYTIVTTALKKGKAVVSANKKLIAEHLPELLALQKEYNVPFLYEAAVCGSIPILRNLEEYFDNDLLQGICGIVNGSTNYILTQLIEEGLEYTAAVQKAQILGFAETDPSVDVKGIDAANKLTILLAHAYGLVIKPQQLLCVGIDKIHAYDAQRAAEKGCRIKLTAQATKLSDGSVAAFVLPQLVTPESQLFTVRNEYNGVVIQSSFADKQFFYGKGAGRYPTASAVLSDISALRYQYRYEYRKLQNSKTVLATNFYLRVYVSFDLFTEVSLKDFECIEEFYSHQARQYIIGVIQYEKLAGANWLQKEGVSLLLCADGIIEDISDRKIRKRSLQLAGAQTVETTSFTLENIPGEVMAI